MCVETEPVEKRLGSVQRMTDDQAVAALSALGNEARLALWQALLPYGDKGVRAGSLAEQLETAPLSLNFHLRALVLAGLVRQRQVQGNFIYSVEANTIARLVNFME